MLPLQGVWVGSLAGELKFLHAMWCGPKERKKKKKKNYNITLCGGEKQDMELITENELCFL